MKTIFSFSLIFIFVFNLTAFSQTTDPLDFSLKINGLHIVPANQDGYGNKANQLAQPDDVEFLKDGSILVSDVNNNRLQYFSKAGDFLKSISADDLNLKGNISPTGIGQDDEGFIYISLEGAATIARLNPDLTFDQFIGKRCDIKDSEYYCGGNDDCLLAPQGLVVSKNGDVFVIDMDVSFRRGANGNIRNFGFRKFKKQIRENKTTFIYDNEFAATQEITSVMRKSEGMAIDEERGILFVAEEKPLAVQFKNKNKNRYVAAFNLQTGIFLDKLYGTSLEDGKIKSGFFNESIEGVTVYKHFLFAVDEKKGCIRAFNIQSGEYLGFWGHRAPFYCDDESDCVIDGTNYNEQSIIVGTAKPHLKNDWRKNELASPDGIDVYTADQGADRLAVVDQWNSRIIIYDLEQIIQVLSKEE